MDASRRDAHHDSQEFGETLPSWSLQVHGPWGNQRSYLKTPSMANNTYSFICSKCFILVKVMVETESLSMGNLGVRWECTLDGRLDHCWIQHTLIRILGILNSPVLKHVLGCGRVMGNLEESQEAWSCGVATLPAVPCGKIILWTFIDGSAVGYYCCITAQGFPRFDAELILLPAWSFSFSLCLYVGFL